MARPKYDPDEVVTRKTLYDAILKGMESMFKEVTSRLDTMDRHFKKVDHILNELKVGQSHHKNQIDGLKADLSDTPSRREFQELKSKVDRHHPGPA